MRHTGEQSRSPRKERTYAKTATGLDTWNARTVLARAKPSAVIAAAASNADGATTVKQNAAGAMEPGAFRREPAGMV